MKPAPSSGPVIDRQRAALIVNTHSRKGRALYDHAKAQLEARGFHFVSAIPLDHPAELHQAMTTIMTQQPSLVIVGGGDGTISTASNYLAYTDTVLGYLPLGTTNNFGRGIGLQQLHGAIDTIVRGQVLAIDLGKAGTTYFTNMASFGVSVAVATQTPRRLKRIFGRPIYALYAAVCTLRHRAITAEVTTDTGHYTFRTHQFVVANGVTHSGIPIAADASVTDGKLITYALGGAAHWSALVAAIRHGLTSHWPMKKKQILVSSHVRVAFLPPQRIDIDGEVAPTDPQATYTIEVAPRALRVLVPAGFASTTPAPPR